jgi:hypothetical protein
MNIIHKHNADTRPVQSIFPANHRRRLHAACGRCYQRALGRLTAVKARIEREFGQAVAGYNPLLKAALVEAEALAWQTPYPHLLFPVLAEEKAAEARKWAVRQRAIWERNLPEQPELQLAA